MSENPDDIRMQLDEIEQEYNGLLATLQAIVEEKGDASSVDPDYIQKYERAQGLNAQFETLQAKLIELETNISTPSPVPEIIPESQEESSVTGQVMDLGIESGETPQELPTESSLELPEGSEASEGEIAKETPPSEEVAPAEPKYITVERTRIEIETIHEQSWSFVGIVSNVSPAVIDLSSKGGYISENVLEKNFGKITLLCPFEVDFPIGVVMAQYIKKAGPKVGFIYYPQATPSMQSNAILNQLLQQFLASKAPRGHIVAYLKINKVNADDKISLIIGGLTDQDAKIKQNLVKKLGNNVYFDNDIFFKGQLLDDVKSTVTKLGFKPITIIGTSNIFQSFDKLQNLVEAF